MSQTTAQQCRSQSTVLRFDRQVVNADYDNRVQDEYLTQKYDIRTWSLLSTVTQDDTLSVSLGAIRKTDTSNCHASLSYILFKDPAVEGLWIPKPLY